MDIFNKYAVAIGAGGAGVTILSPPGWREKISKADALLLAAWIVALADPLDQHFDEILHEVKNS